MTADLIQKRIVLLLTLQNQDTLGIKVVLSERLNYRNIYEESKIRILLLLHQHNDNFPISQNDLMFRDDDTNDDDDDKTLVRSRKYAR
jgi:hypothetical protein